MAKNNGTANKNKITRTTEQQITKNVNYGTANNNSTDIQGADDKLTPSEKCNNFSKYCHCCLKTSHGLHYCIVLVVKTSADLSCSR